MKNKIIIFKSQKEHFWYSCRIIEQHILNAFQRSKLDYEIYEWKECLNQEQIKRLKEETSQLHFYFLSDYIFQQDLCYQLKMLSIEGTYYIPIYGNMTVEVHRWLSLGKLLKDQKVYLIGASQRSCNQIRNFVDADVIEIPFCFETPLRKKPRNDDKVHLIYAGRITPQKNVYELLKTFLEAYNYNQSLHLHIAGNFHQRKYHLHGYDLDFDLFEKEIRSLMVHPSITYHQNLNQDKLLDLYQSCDHFISISTYHDEDFGMSACQAAVMGLGLILSDWGGHAAFKKNSSFVPLKVNDISLPEIESMKLLKILAGLSHNLTDTEYQHYFGYEAFINRLSEKMQSPPKAFRGLKDLYQKYAELGLKTFPFNNLEKSPNKRDFYLRIYQSYFLDK